MTHGFPKARLAGIEKLFKADLDPARSRLSWTLQGRRVYPHRPIW